MRWDDVYVAGCAAALGRSEAATDAVADGRYDQVDCEADGYLATCLASDSDMMELAVAAAQRAVRRCAQLPSDLAMVLHASCRHAEPKYLAPASYIQSHTVGGSAVALEINQHSNGDLVAMECAAAYLTALDRPAAALLTAAEPNAAPDPYRAEKGIVFGDGATAMVVTNHGGVARVLSTVVLADCTYSDLPADRTDHGEGGRIEYLVEHGARLMQMVAALTALQTDCIGKALAEVGLASGDVARWVFANTGLSQIDWEVRRAFSITPTQTTWEWGRRTGHLGAGDHFGGLAYLLESGQLGPGDRVAMCGVGFGFTVSCVIVEILRDPAAQWRAELPSP